MKRLKITIEGHDLYMAGLPGFPRVFSRDSLISGIIASDPEMLKNQILFSALKQGKKINHITGEEPGKIFHEYPGVDIRGSNTEFCACDTTALFLIAIRKYHDITNDSILIKHLKSEIELSIKYILRHIKNGFFMEDPAYCESDQFALKVTYWKDSCLVGRKNGYPDYPIVYSLAHVMNLHALRKIAPFSDKLELTKVITAMRNRVSDLFDPQLKTLCIGIDNQGMLSRISSDSLHALYYMEPGDLEDQQLKDLCETATNLETPIGYRTQFGIDAEKLTDGYHSRTVWPFEQAMIHKGAKKFKFSRIAKVSSRIMKWLDTAPEIFVISTDKTEKGGCDPQLWTLAAKKYFT